jgi:4-hydroxybenzoate polyprenyltransferase
VTPPGTDEPSGLRRLGYRVLGSRFDYLLHLRPAEWPIMAAHTALGYVLAVGWDGVGRGEQLGSGLLGIAAWVLGLNAGTLAENSAFDRDDGDIGYLRRPPPPPPHLFGFGLGLMLLGLAASLLLPVPYRLAYVACFILSLAYSAPPVRLKAVPGMDWLINMVGFGALTPFAGWAATGRPLDAGVRLVFVGFCLLFAGMYPLTQLYQLEEDRRRGDRTLALLLGVRTSLGVSILATIGAFQVFALGAVIRGWLVRGEQWRWFLLSGALAAWLAVLLPWLVRSPRLAPAAHQRAMYLALGAWALTDLAVLFGWAT